MVVYRCRVLGKGTGTASTHLHPMLDAWAQSEGYSLVPGTLNLCASSELVLPEEFTSLRPFAHLAPAHRRDHQAFDPRLYPVRLNGFQPAWLYRWSAPENVRIFVGEVENCAPEYRCEIVADVHLRRRLALSPGNAVDLELL